METKSSKKRLFWIDWLKVIGIYFIVLGHFSSYFSDFIYIFNVPLFFIISGFLSKHEDKSIFWKKLFFNLIVPMLIICAINYGISNIFAIFQNTATDPFLTYAKWAIIGDWQKLGTCWFIYTLVIIKIINWLARTTNLMIIISILFLTGAYMIRHYLSEVSFLTRPNSIIDVCTAFPFFTIGILCKQINNYLSELKSKSTLITLFVVGLLLMVVCERFNSSNYMYMCVYGNNILLFLIGGFAGTSTIFSLSKMLHSKPNSIVTLSKGTILILGFHPWFILWIRTHQPTPSLFDFLFALLIVLFFIPIILFSEKYFPIILGKYRITKS